MRKANKYLPLLSVWIAALCFHVSMSTPLFLLLQLLHFKPALCFRVPLLTADLAALRLHFFPLQLECLLRLCADAGGSVCPTFFINEFS